MRRTSIALAVGLAALARAEAARADDTRGLLVERLDAAPAGSDWMALDSLHFGELQPAFRAFESWASKPLVATSPDGSEAPIVHDMVTLHLGASLGLWRRLRLDADVPFSLYVSGNTQRVIDRDVPAAEVAGLGDLRLGATARVVGREGGPFVGALALRFFFPTGPRAGYFGDGSARAEPRAAIAGVIGRFEYAGDFGFHLRARRDDIPGVTIASEVAFGASAGVRILDGALLVGPELFGATTIVGPSAGATATTPVELVGGLHYTGGPLRFGAAAGGGLTHGIGAPHARIAVTLDVVPDLAPQRAPIVASIAPRDRDGDGVPDALDACPDAAGRATKDPQTNGCPDRDDDGIVDRFDACPDEPGVVTDDRATNGCPDRDKDGVVDRLDACPDEPGPRSIDPQANGCPDQDLDGIPDKLDACKADKGVPSDDPKKNGCPADVDTDKDGIRDEDDACPTMPGPANDDPRKAGCPKIYLTDREIKVTDPVRFRPNSAEILAGPDGVDVLARVATAMKEHPELKRVRVEGHTDAQGVPAANKKLSLARARAVVKWLVAHGVDASRLGSEGFGQEKPIEANLTEQGRRRNRRVEFRILQRDEVAVDPKP